MPEATPLSLSDKTGAGPGASSIQKFERRKDSPVVTQTGVGEGVLGVWSAWQPRWPLWRTGRAGSIAFVATQPEFAPPQL